MVRGILGNFHQGANCFRPFNGMQCTAMSLIAVLALSHFGQEPVSRWNSLDIDGILHEGNNLYASIVENLQEVRYLSLNDLPNHATFQNLQYRTHHATDLFYGIVDGNNALGFGQTPFLDSFSQSVLLSRYQILTLNGLTVALDIDPERNRFLIFDSHESSVHGLHSDNGKAVLLSFDSFGELFSFISDHYSGYAYELTPVNLSQMQFYHQNNQQTNSSYAQCFSYVNQSLQNENDDESYYTAYYISMENLQLLQTDNFIFEHALALQPSENFHHEKERLVPSEEIKNICNHNHTYFSSKGKSKNRKSSKQKSSSIDVLNVEDLCNEFPAMCMLDVGFVCNVSTAIDLAYIDYETCNHHVEMYEKNIRLKPEFCCRSCNRFLFKDQVIISKKENQVTKLLSFNFTSCVELCCTCYSAIIRNKIPSITYNYNNCYEPGVTRK